jgi:hypothetical protein
MNLDACLHVVSNLCGKPTSEKIAYYIKSAALKAKCERTLRTHEFIKLERKVIELQKEVKGLQDYIDHLEEQFESDSSPEFQDEDQP